MQATPQHAVRIAIAEALETAPLGIAATGAGGRIEYANGHLARVLGLTPAELTGFELAQFRAFATARLRVEVRSALTRGETWQGEVALQTGGPRVVRVLESSCPVVDGGGRITHVVHFFHELALLERAESLTRAAFYDRVTGLPGRGAFDERLAFALAHARRRRSGVAVLYSDVEHFGRVNALLEPAAGDALLAEMGARMTHALRASDTVARLSGDEFAALLPDVPAHEAALHVAGKLRRACSGWYESQGQRQAVSISVGASVFPLDADDAQGLVRRAQSAMYRVKAANRDAYDAQARAIGTPYLRNL
jgi:diguanylate cyclase (GGDEF)-like protein